MMRTSHPCRGIGRARRVPILADLLAAELRLAPTTALAFSSTIAEAGSSKLTLPALSAAGNRRRYRVDVDFEAHAERRLRTHTRTDPTQLDPGDGAMQFQRLAPVRLVAERLVAEHPSAFVQQLPRAFSVNARSLGATVGDCALEGRRIHMLPSTTSTGPHR
jgi:hypothetical protein